MWELLGKPPLRRSGVGQPGCPESSPETKTVGWGWVSREASSLAGLYLQQSCLLVRLAPALLSGTGSHAAAFPRTVPSASNIFPSVPTLIVTGPSAGL